MSDEKPKAPPGGPPKLERVPAGYRPPASVRPPAGAAPPAPRPPASGPPPAARPPAPPASAPPQAPPRPAAPAPAPGAAPGASYGLAAREVGADAAIGAGIAHQGSLAKESGLHLLALAAAAQATGRLTITPEGGSFALSIRRGTVEHVASSDPADDLGAFLVRKGALGEDRRQEAEAGKAALGGDLAAALVARQLLNPADVATHLQEHGALLVQRALAVEAGGWSWKPDAPPPPSAFPLGNPFAMLCQSVRALDATAVLRRLGDREHLAAARIGGRVGIEDLRLTPQEARAASLFDGARSPGQIAQASPADTLVVLRLALLLGEVGLLSFGASRKGAPAAPPRSPAPPAPTASPAAGAPAPKPPPAAAAAPPKPAGGPAPASRPPAAPPKPPAAPAKPALTPPPKPATTPVPRPAALDRAALEALHAKLAGADHFEVLGVKRDVAGPQVKTAYFQLAKTYHPDAVPADAPPEVRKLCADVFAKVSEAWSVLADDASRAGYLEELKSGGAADLDVMKILHAENVFQEATLLVKGRNWSGALKKLDEAIQLNPEEAEFSMWKAWCEFLLAEDKRRKLPAATGAIEAALKRNPNCAQGYLFLGQMAKVAGDVALAEKQLRRGLQIAPEHQEMQRELKYLKK